MVERFLISVLWIVVLVPCTVLQQWLLTRVFFVKMCLTFHLSTQSFLNRKAKHRLFKNRRASALKNTPPTTIGLVSAVFCPSKAFFEADCLLPLLPLVM